jgi:hypothetical protein
MDKKTRGHSCCSQVVRNRNRTWTNTKTDLTFKVLEQDILFTVLLDFLVWQIEESQVRANRRITGKGK